MIFSGEFVSGIDLVDVCLWLFTLFFIGLVLYLQREGMREGYPLEDDTTGRVDTAKHVFGPSKRIAHLPHGRPDADLTEGPRDTRDLALQRTAPWPGAPYAPTGDPMTDGVGPASYAERSDYPDLTLEGEPRIQPYRLHPEYSVREGDIDPRGLPVIAADGEQGGVISDLWVDRSESIIRYLEVEVPLDGGATRKALLPVPFAKVVGGRKPHVAVEAINAAHFVKVPAIKSPDSITRLEEDKVSGFYGGGKFYATAARSEPLL
ncbi:MAG: photosynthetic reaction center subunit H [Pseudomonadota bacterium]